MTTVAIRDGVLAVDSLATQAGWKVSLNVPKLFKTRSGEVGAKIGSVASADNFLLWMTRGRRGRPPDLKEATVVLLSKSGKTVTVFEGDGSFQIDLIKEPFVAFGSGMAAALGAMHAGANARRAVEIACMLDTSTGGEVCWSKVKG